MRRLEADEVRKISLPDVFGHLGSAAFQPLEGILGQERAVAALQFGLNIHAEGFHVFVVGQPGTGRTTAVKTYLENIARTLPVPDDIAYVYNFQDPQHPRSLILPAGEGEKLKRAMADFVETVLHELPKAFEDERFQESRQKVMQQFDRERQERIARLSAEAAQYQFALEFLPQGIYYVPLKDGKPLSDEDFQKLSEEEKTALNERREALQTRLGQAMREFRLLERNLQEALKELDRSHAKAVLDVWLMPLLELFAAHQEVVHYLHDVREDMLDELPLLLNKQGGAEVQRMRPTGTRDDLARRYRINVIVDHRETKGAPVIVERNPTFPNLIGRIEREAIFGALVTDYTLLRAGSLLKANGGFLIIPVEELLKAPYAWDGLKRTLRAMRLVIEDVGEQYGLLAAKALRPEPVPLKIKVVLIGSPIHYYLLFQYDPEIRELFKVKAEFATTMPRTEENERAYASFFRTLSEKERLRPLTAGAMAKLVEHGARLAGEQGKLATRFAELADVVREANFYAEQEGGEADEADVKQEAGEDGEITAAHIEKSLKERFYRSSLLKERIEELYDQGVLLVHTDGKAVGAVNGLAVLSIGDLTFGVPKRITVTVSAGREGIIDIERESRLGGNIHTKGVLILSGYLRERYAREAPFPLAAQIVFEQSYDGVDGDSASSTELYALLSALAEIPLRQDLAVTGSVNQKGEIQAIGGVNEKIEGFFDICQQKGLTGTQGVIIPEANVQNLMLREDVVQHIREGTFHIYAVRTVDEGIELLTGIPAGKPDESGEYPEDSLHGRVIRRLRAFQAQLRRTPIPLTQRVEAATGQEERKEEPHDPEPKP
ncbi:MAG: AAA family ATPase [Candidatus Carbobacillus altaicus]|nr:AAA family ATPase [Candidatus Carbobacillus altaicus]